MSDLNISLGNYLIDDICKLAEVAQVDQVIGAINDIEVTIGNIFGQIFSHIGNDEVFTAPDNVGRNFYIT
ncbi:MAG: hypothetical protein UW84_C0029G0022 [Candidatus Collierbacteria bacterium GW2011_GWA2_44_99]|uniref:Uncharacterized protein n=1 Tax=Candidatus Collierbacteria bacterium GW2011_GWA2_44_99 TaxID=1618380 RepID=A0A0G1KPB0_9BACT|nr:MAG: hypothetical protein UW84_C0029G0022 [Candidatus Collierbacteria bacterium GW2011_GWA2_44_99]